MPTSVVSFDKLEAPLFALMELMTTYISRSRARQPFHGGDRSFDQDEFFTMGAWTLARKAWFRLANRLRRLYRRRVWG